MSQFGVYLVNQNSGQVFPVSQEHETVIGRGIGAEENPTASILLPDPSISKKHARVYMDSPSQRWHFEDFSRHGSQVNGKLVEGEAIPIQHGDQIAIGPYKLVFYEKFQADATMEVKVPPRLSISKAPEEKEVTPLGSTVETVAILAIVFITALILLFCFA
jgi:pSer/pThr/pTyr-binding forkhead associated (FHA) protein